MDVAKLEAIIGAYREAESSIMTLLSQALAREAKGTAVHYQRQQDAMRRVLAAAEGILAKANAATSDAARELILAEFRGAVNDASILGGAGPVIQSSIPTDAIGVLAMETVTALASTGSTVLRNVEDVYRDVMSTVVSRQLASGATKEAMLQQALNRFADRGVFAFQDRAGRKWSLDTYVDMALRTGANRASNEGRIVGYKEAGVQLVRVSSHRGSAPQCAPYQGKLLSLDGMTGPRQMETFKGTTITVNVVDTLDGAIKEGYHHPNCKHVDMPYIPGTEAPPMAPYDEADHDTEQRQRAIERHIRRWKRREAVATTPNEAAYSRMKVRTWQAQQRQHIKAHPWLSRRYNRERTKFGMLGVEPVTRKPFPTDLITTKVDPRLALKPVPARAQALASIAKSSGDAVDYALLIKHATKVQARKMGRVPDGLLDDLMRLGEQRRTLEAAKNGAITPFAPAKLNDTIKATDAALAAPIERAQVVLLQQMDYQDRKLLALSRSTEKQAGLKGKQKNSQFLPYLDKNKSMTEYGDNIKVSVDHLIEAHYGNPEKWGSKMSDAIQARSTAVEANHLAKLLLPSKDQGAYAKALRQADDAVLEAAGYQALRLERDLSKATAGRSAAKIDKAFPLPLSTTKSGVLVRSTPGGKSFPVQAAKISDLETGFKRTLTSVNPNYGVDRAWGVNCDRVSNSAELQARGYKTTIGHGSTSGIYEKTDYQLASDSMGTLMGSNSEVTLAVGWRTKDGKVRSFFSADPATVQKKQLNSNTIEQMEASVPNGARGTVQGNWKAGGGHIWNWEKEGGKIHFYEFQTQNGKLSDPSVYLDRLKDGSLKMVRLDDMEPTDQLLYALGVG